MHTEQQATPSTTTDTRYWHPFGSMGTIRRQEFVVTRADDVWIWNDAGDRFLDATASLWCVNVGHGRQEIVDAVTAQMTELATYQTFHDFANPAALTLARRLAELSPMEDSRVMLGSGGGDAIDTAAKLARDHFVRTGQPERTALLHRHHSYHGTHGFGTSLAGMPANRLGAPYNPDTFEVPYDDPVALEREILRIGPGRVAAFFAEPVIGGGGILAPPAGYFERVSEICRRHGVLLIADAVICGFGRLGTWFGIERFGVAPDLIVFAKGVTSGYLPLGGVMVSGAVAAPFWDDPTAAPFRHGVTYAGHPAACAAALANIDILEREGLLERSLALESTLMSAVGPLDAHPLIASARGGVGAMCALELDPERIAADPALPMRLSRAIRGHGAIVRPMTSALGFSPPLTLADEQLDLLVDAVQAGLDELA